jgi:hypothetical protein
LFPSIGFADGGSSCKALTLGRGDMFKGFIFGIAKGCIVAAVVVAMLRALGADWSSPLVVYAATALAGILTGLVAGNPVWARGGKVEGLLKSVVGTFIAVTVMFGLRKWLPHTTVDLGPLGAGALGYVPAAALPLVTSALALVFEVDNGFGPGPVRGPRQRVAISEAPPSVEPVDESSSRARRRREG